MSSAIKKTKKIDRLLAREIQQGDREAFEQLFFRYHHDLCAAAARIIGSSEKARDVVQEVFLKLWRSRQSLQIDVSVKAYLFRAVYNEALNARQKQKNRRKLIDALSDLSAYDEVPVLRISDSPRRLIKEIWRVVVAMPERRRFVFSLHRKEGLSYQEISVVMGISQKTVENHMGLALKEIRESIDPSLLL